MLFWGMSIHHPHSFGGPGINMFDTFGVQRSEREWLGALLLMRHNMTEPYVG